MDAVGKVDDSDFTARWKGLRSCVSHSYLLVFPRFVRFVYFPPRASYLRRTNSSTEPSTIASDPLRIVTFSDGAVVWLRGQEAQKRSLNSTGNEL